MTTTSSLTLDDVRSAAKRIAGFAHRTPVVTCRTIDELAGCQVFFKCEHFQKVGAFKFRGAYNAVARLTDSAAERGVVTHSSGNHAQALALAAKMRGIPAYIVMPRTASPVKRAGVEGYGAEVIPCEPTQAAREATTAEVEARTGATFIHPYNNLDVMAGQGTATIELCEQTQELGTELDAIISPVGGGGLLSGTCIAAKGINPALRVFAGEPSGADDAARSMAAGQLTPQTGPNTIADGLLTSLGDLTWPIIRDNVEAIITVSDEQIVAAMRLLWERAKLLIEPSSAVVLAAILDDRFRQRSQVKAIGAILSGGNVNLDKLPW